MSTSVNQHEMQFPSHILPTMNGGYNGVPNSALPPLMSLPSTQSNQAVTSLTQGQMRYTGMNHTQKAPTINGTYQGATSLPYTASQPLVALPSTEGNQALTWLQQGHILHQGIPSQAPTVENLDPQTSSIAQQADIPIYKVASTSTQSLSTSVAIHEPTGVRPQEIAKPLLNYVGHEESEPLSKRIKHESGSAYKPDGINFPNSVITELSEYYMYIVTYCFTSLLISVLFHEVSLCFSLCLYICYQGVQVSCSYLFSTNCRTLIFDIHESAA